MHAAAMWASLIDTSYCYGSGHNEMPTGTAISERKRKDCRSVEKLAAPATPGSVGSRPHRSPVRQPDGRRRFYRKKRVKPRQLTGWLATAGGGCGGHRFSKRVDAHATFVATIGFVRRDTVNLGVECVVAAHPHVASRVDSGTALTHENIARLDRLAGEKLDPATLPRAVATVAGRALSLFMRQR